MAIRHCGSAGNLKLDEVVRINHRDMKVILHRASSRTSMFRVFLAKPATPPATALSWLHVSERVHGTGWTLTASSMPEAMRQVIRDFLAHRNDHDTYYIEEADAGKLVARLRATQDRAAKQAALTKELA
jgi:hypothetical protein